MNLQNLKSEKKTLVDVRTPQEFSEGHVPGAVNIPLDQVPHRLAEFEVMEKSVIAYCRSGNRSGMAVAILKQHGVNEVYNGGALTEVSQQLQ